MTCNFYLRNGIVYIPTLGKVETGGYRDIEPVAVVPVSHTVDLRRALRETMARGNPIVPSLSPDNLPTPVVLKYAQVKTWATFNRGTSVWPLDETDGVYQIEPYRRRKDRGWEQDPSRYITLPPGTDVNAACERFVAVLQEAAKK
jgi:hypothetical protein